MLLEHHPGKLELMPRLGLFILVLLNLFFIFPPLGVLAEFQSSEIAYYYQVNDKEAEDGDILINKTGQGITRTNLTADSHMFGILQTNSPFTYKLAEGETGKPILRNGTALVNVTTLAGEIKIGDYITSSEITGFGQKAEASGYVLGTALADFKNSTKTTTYKDQKVFSGQVPIALKIEYAEVTSARSFSSFFSAIGTALFKSSQDPEKFTQIVRYISAGLAVILSLAVGLLTLGRSLPKSIEAIGRNPLAANSIRFSMILNIIVTVLMGLIGIVAAIVILKI